MRLDRDYPFDAQDRQNNSLEKFTDADLLECVENIHAVLMTRSMRCVYLYRPPLTEYLRPYFEGPSG